MALVIDVHLLGDRWFGVGDWPPSPFRLFQAMIAGAYGGRWRTEDDATELDRAFAWLETLAPPQIVAPRYRDLRTVAYFVPDNDLDAKGNDPRNVGEIRSGKSLKSKELVDGNLIRYIWKIEDGAEEPARRVALLSERLHLFGRGVDAAFASAEVRSGDDSILLTEVDGIVSRPSREGTSRGGELALPCPTPGSLRSLHDRHDATRRRFVRGRIGMSRGEIAFVQPPKAISRLIAYDRPTRILLFELRKAVDDTAFMPVALEAAGLLTTSVRDLLMARLQNAVSENVDLERIVLGRNASDADRSRRIRVIPLPSVGTSSTNMAIRRIAVLLPPDTPLSDEDVSWSLAGQMLMDFSRLDSETGEVSVPRLIPTRDTSMLRFYAIGDESEKRASAVWRSVTPIALPLAVERVRASGSEVLRSKGRAVAAIVAAIRHAGLTGSAIRVDTQVEPYMRRGSMATKFDALRFGVDRLIHAEITFDRPMRGPIVLGDGRWVGLGLMMPIVQRHTSDVTLAQAPSDAEAVEEDVEEDEEVDET